jgi:3-oxoacyl-[acyl-carrier protein] reductase
MKLEGRVAVVTGASGGIGRAVALAFAREGAKVVVHYHRSEAAAEDVAREIADASAVEAITVQADITREDEIDRLVGATLDRFGRIDVWANIAGYDILTGAARELRDPEKLERLIAVDLRGTVLASWAAAEVMEEGGVILNTSWDRATTGASGRESELFCAVKGGIAGFSKALAQSLAPRIRVNVLAPGWIATAFYDTLSDSARERIAGTTPLARWGTPEDIARGAVFLASEDSAYVTGQTLLIGGGEVM